MKKAAHSLMTGTLSSVDSKDLVDTDSGAASGAVASDEVGEVKANDETMEEGEKPTINFLEDDISEMTYSRRIALYLMQYSWYLPKPKEQEEQKQGVTNEGDSTPHVIDDFERDISFEKPDLRNGWAFFEHQTLYRFRLPEDYADKEKHGILTRMFRTCFLHRNKKFEKVEPGENKVPSRLYPVNTPHKQLGDFGLGIGLYFSNLRALILISLLCGFISMGNILYFASDRYDESNSSEWLSFETFTLAGSAACSNNEWVPCPDCHCSKPWLREEDLFLRLNRCALATNEKGEELQFALKNKCDGTTYLLAASNFATVCCMFLCTFLMGRYMKREEVKFDEDVQTAQDYSIQIKNPPDDAKDPEEWRSFFKDNFDGAQAVVCTCAVENDLLVKSLVQRRELIRKIHSLQPGESMKMLDIAKKAAHIRRERTFFGSLLAKIIPDIPECYDKLVSLKGLVEGLAQLDYPVTNVFITFETEEDQRRVLEKLSVGYRAAKANNQGALSDKKYLFRGNQVLDVCEPEEPSTIRWQDLNASIGARLKQQVYTLVYTLVLLAAVFYIIYAINLKNPVWATYTISIFNAAFPMAAKAMTAYCETHQSESQYQASLYYKLVLFRWVTSALIFFTIIPFTDIITYGENGLLERIYLQFFSDLTISNGLILLDPLGHLHRHFLAPRAKTQDQMNILFEGTRYELAERYTDMTKILFLCLVYSSIFPISFFLCAISLSLKYFVDRFTLMRTWKPAAAIGPTISSISRKYFFSMAIGVMAIVCSYYWTGFPFDNLCVDEGSMVSDSYVGTFTLSPFPDMIQKSYSTKVTSATIVEGDLNYKVCNMNFLGNLPSVSFPFVPGTAQFVENLDPDAYMTDEQLVSTRYFGWSAFGLMLLIVFNYFRVWYTQYQDLYQGGYKPVGKAQETPFSKVDFRSAYIPQVSSASFAFPLFACQIDNIDQELFDFQDPSRSYLYYDLTNDAEKLVSDNVVEDLTTFTVVKSWPAEKKE